MENVVKKLGILGSSPYQLPQSGLLGALPGLTQQQQQMNGISHALNAGECLKFLANKLYSILFIAQNGLCQDAIAFWGQA